MDSAKDSINPAMIQDATANLHKLADSAKDAAAGGPIGGSNIVDITATKGFLSARGRSKGLISFFVQGADHIPHRFDSLPA